MEHMSNGVMVMVNGGSQKWDCSFGTALVGVDRRYPLRIQAELWKVNSQIASLAQIVQFDF